MLNLILLKFKQHSCQLDGSTNQSPNQSAGLTVPVFPSPSSVRLLRQSINPREGTRLSPSSLQTVCVSVAPLHGRAASDWRMFSFSFFFLISPKGAGWAEAEPTGSAGEISGGGNNPPRVSAGGGVCRAVNESARLSSITFPACVCVCAWSVQPLLC